MLMKHSPRLTAVLAGIGIVAAMERVDRRGDPAAATVIGALRAIHSAQETFASNCSGSYAPSLQALRVPPRGASAGFISLALGSDAMGYAIDIDPSDEPLARLACSGVPVVSAYFAHAEPPPGEQRPSFAMDEAGIIYSRQDGRRISADFEGAQRLR